MTALRADADDPALGLVPGSGFAPMRLLIYAQDGLGLGHMRRVSEIASEVLRRSPGSSVLTVEDSPLGNIFDRRRNHDYVKLPSIRKLGPGEWEALDLALPFDQVSALRRDMLISAVVGFRPDLVLVDHMPHGAMGELIPALEALRNVAPGAQVVLGLRDILDAPDVITARWEAEGAYDALERYYDAVLVYGSRGVFDIGRKYRFPPQIAERIRYCGYLCAAAAARYPSRIRARFVGGPLSHRRLLVAMAGGGADAHPAMGAVIDGLAALEADERPTTVIVAGPFMPTTLRRDLQRRSAGLPVRVTVSVADPLSYIEAADLVVAMAGYNTTMEILRSSKPSLLIPRSGPSAEQRLRARAFRRRGWIDAIDLDAASGEAVAARIRLGLDRGPIHLDGAGPDLGGLGVAADHLLSLAPRSHAVGSVV